MALEHGHRFVASYLALLLFVGSFLVISIQPAATAALLPQAGGHPFLWHTLQAVFQGLLLVGYSLAPRLNEGARVALHLGALASLAFWPMTFIDLKANDALSPLAAAGWAVIGYGAPFIVLSTLSLSGQMVWQRATGQPGYWLYGVSNAGSLAAVGCYPTLIQPRLALDDQLWLWRIVTAVILLASIVAFAARAIATQAQSSVVVTWRTKLCWCFAGALPVGLSLAFTTKLQVDLGSHPAVWLVPLGTYLLTMIVAFSSAASRVGPLVRPLVLPLSLLLVLGLAEAFPPAVNRFGFVINTLTSAVLLMALHLEVARLRPAYASAVYYRWLILGGISASVALAHLAPLALNPELFGRVGMVVFSAGPLLIVPEYFILIVISLAWIQYRLREEQNAFVTYRLIGYVLLVAMSAAAFVIASGSGQTGLAGCVVVLGLAFSGEPSKVWPRWPLAVLVAATVPSTISVWNSDGLVFHGRSMFGTVRVLESGSYRRLLHGTTHHGEQPTSCVTEWTSPRCLESSGYYHAGSPVIRSIARMRAEIGSLNMAVLGLGTGTLATHCSAADRLTFLEIDPLVIRVANEYFSYLAASTCGRLRIIEGDGRLQARAIPRGSLDLMVLDAFSSDAIPTHLVTVEALREYRTTLRPDTGLIVVHISNRRYDFDRALLPTAQEAGLVPRVLVGEQDLSRQMIGSKWLLLFQSDVAHERWKDIGPDRQHSRTAERSTARSWTDGRSSIFDVLR